MALTIGILSLQGCVEPHFAHIEALGVSYKEVKFKEDFDVVDALILPGGESSTMLKLLKIFDLEDIFLEHAQKKPVWGICAGAILMAKEVINPAQKAFGLMDYVAERNGYGRQLDSCQTEIKNYPVSFIRAPKIQKIGKDVEVVAEFEGTPVWIKQGRCMATTFHPELTEDYPSSIHTAFINMVKAYYQ
ncbi:MAG: pyridoxal 5'-phosphate synthase glutaminase subunit PdxT [Alphaproteobacteria bacterium]